MDQINYHELPLEQNQTTFEGVQLIALSHDLSIPHCNQVQFGVSIAIHDKLKVDDSCPNELYLDPHGRHMTYINQLRESEFAPGL